MYLDTQTTFLHTPAATNGHMSNEVGSGLGLQVRARGGRQGFRVGCLNPKS